ncbi:hypothetical protein THICB1_30271 [Thiomonas arsenitoxydans]|uniref:Uncharacterized protein n=1 Tax=Thiomonas arsenitoxydans (strain DSM 22701 / CIP 110005 / 3As) TaxID=426114 RepID=A0ABP1Z3Q9_THIA3|nr:hypothetical protein ACO7_340064 [Thiomonas arsenitoxydans]CQR33053.1 hypothetical protein ACO3_360064 [Thiomonas arsenitoxydans]CQR33915.1 hypothetical protein THICB1_30271 [Thiomonas arsenitoxydans]CQR40258.1 hypothetical protein THICB6_80272 [Thiomonas arsenitoxydans]
MSAACAKVAGGKLLGAAPGKTPAAAGLAVAAAWVKFGPAPGTGADAIGAVGAPVCNLPGEEKFTAF